MSPDTPNCPPQGNHNCLSETTISYPTPPLLKQLQQTMAQSKVGGLGAQLLTCPFFLSKSFLYRTQFSPSIQ